jgi:hypothetical protein
MDASYNAGDKSSLTILAPRLIQPASTCEGSARLIASCWLRKTPQTCLHSSLCDFHLLWWPMMWKFRPFWSKTATTCLKLTSHDYMITFKNSTFIHLRKDWMHKYAYRHTYLWFFDYRQNLGVDCSLQNLLSYEVSCSSISKISQFNSSVLPPSYLQMQTNTQFVTFTINKPLKLWTGSNTWSQVQERARNHDMLTDPLSVVTSFVRLLLPKLLW